MEVLNKRERLWSFLLFMFLFSITVATIVIAIFFDYQIPKKELTNLRSESKILVKEKSLSMDFTKIVKSYTKAIENLDGKDGEGNRYSREQAVDRELLKLQNLLADSITSNNMYEYVLINLEDLYESKKEISTTENEGSEVERLEKDKKRLEKQVKRLEKETDMKDAKLEKKDIEIDRCNAKLELFS